jgi:hypothetical protein
MLSAGHPPVTMGTQQLAQEPAHQSCILLEHKGPGGPALTPNLHLSEMRMRLLQSLPPRLWPPAGRALLAFQPLGCLRPS